MDGLSKQSCVVLLAAVYLCGVSVGQQGELNK